jgi:lipoprotein-releasing system ATP-binding protein
MSENRPITLKADGIHKSYSLGGRTFHILKGASLEIARGEVLGIVGTSGAGKSTLLHILGLLDNPDRGDVFFEEEKMTHGATRARRGEIRNHGIGFVFQFYHLFPDLTSLENVLLGPMMRHGVFGWMSARKEAKEKAADLLDSLGLGDRLRHRPPQLSGGERQRVAIARALICSPTLLLCDEPTGNLDERTSAGIAELLLRLNEERNQTMVLVTHNDSLARSAGRLLRLSSGVLNQES